MIGPRLWALGSPGSATSRPDEYLKVPAKSVHPKNGLLSFRFLEPMEETVYLDQVRLLPSIIRDVEVNPNERFASAPPFPEFRVIVTEHPQLPVGAWDDHGNDVLPLLAKRDAIRHQLRPAYTDSPNCTGSNSISANGTRQNPASAPGWLHRLFTATSMYAANQRTLRSLRLTWKRKTRRVMVRVVEDMGFPPAWNGPWSRILAARFPPPRAASASSPT